MDRFKIYYNKYAVKKIPSQPGVLASISSTGQYHDALVKVDDASVPAADVLYSSLKLDGDLATKADLSVPSAAGNLASIDALGQYQDSLVKVDDAAVPAADVLYSSARPKVFMLANFDAIAIPIGPGNQLTATVSTDPFSIWTDGNKAVIPRNGYYVITASLRLGPSAAAVADRWAQFECFAGLRAIVDRFTTGSAIAGVGDNDSIMFSIASTEYLLAGEEIKFGVTNGLNVAKSVTAQWSYFSIIEIV